ncbi:hypothetical protein [Nocardioides pantholopis]|uniref:hypothetical protein n=1 Tax=Nocardioides pantholopis TaxID=2483798 RepID=UPI000F0905C1|nr:hypothetical protein [Nocardioides pantholopis]
MDPAPALRSAGRVLVPLLALVLGLATALATVAVHGRWWGLALGLAATVAAAVALPPGRCRVAYAVGWAAMLGYLVVPRGEGDYAVGGNVPGYTLLVAALLLVVAALVTLPRPGEAGEQPGSP